VPLSDSNIIQSNSGDTGTTAPASVNATLGVGTTANNDVILIVNCTVSVANPIGFVLDRSHINGTANAMYVFRHALVPAGETSWTITPSAAAPVAWVVYEVSGLAAAPLDASASSGNTANTLDQSTGSTGTTSATDVLIVAAHGTWNEADATEVTWSAHTNSFVESHDVSTNVAAAANNVALSVSRRFPGAVGTWECTATQSRSTEASGIIVVYKSSSSPTVDPLIVHTGFEDNTKDGLTGGNTTNKRFDATANIGQMSHVTGRSGTGLAMRFLKAALSSYLRWGANTLGTGKTVLVFSVYLKIDAQTSSTSSICGVRDVAAVAACRFYRILSTGAIRCQVGTGTAVDGPAVALGTWFRLDGRYTVSGTQYTCDWSVDGVAQTQALSQTGLTATTILDHTVAWDNADDLDISADDWCVSTTTADYPLGEYKVVRLDVNSAALISGAAANSMSRFINNGTIDATFVAADVVAAVSEVPVLIGATASGVTQRTAGAGNAVELGLSTYAAGGGETIDACRIMVAGWSGSATANNVAVRAFDGTSESVLFGPADPNFDNATVASATVPAWCCKMWTPTGGWSQAKLDAAAVRFGYSTDIAPNPGAHAMYAEVAVRVGAVVILPPKSLILSSAVTRSYTY